MTSTQLEALTTKAKIGDVKALENLLLTLLSRGKILVQVSLYKGETIVELSGGAVNQNKDKVVEFVATKLDEVIPGGREFSVIKVSGEKTAVQTEPAKKCFSCGSKFSGLSAVNCTETHGLSSAFGICSQCLVKERSWECVSCNTVVMKVKGFRTPKCDQCSAKLILDKNQILSRRIAESPDAKPNDVKQSLSKEEALAAEHQVIEISRKVSAIVTTTSNRIEGHKIEKYCGVVVGSAIAKGRMPTDDLSSRSLTGAALELIIDRAMAEQMQIYLMNATREAEASLKFAAFEAGANAVIGIDVDYVGSKIMQVYMNGTAVCLKSENVDSKE